MSFILCIVRKNIQLLQAARAPNSVTTREACRLKAAGMPEPILP